MSWRWHLVVGLFVLYAMCIMVTATANRHQQATDIQFGPRNTPSVDGVVVVAVCGHIVVGSVQTASTTQRNHVALLLFQLFATRSDARTPGGPNVNRAPPDRTGNVHRMHGPGMRAPNAS